MVGARDSDNGESQLRGWGSSSIVQAAGRCKQIVWARAVCTRSETDRRSRSHRSLSRCWRNPVCPCMHCSLPARGKKLTYGWIEVDRQKNQSNRNKMCIVLSLTRKVKTEARSTQILATILTSIVSFLGGKLESGFENLLETYLHPDLYELKRRGHNRFGHSSHEPSETRCSSGRGFRV